jgi:uncharacterized protein YeaO (DUF488 family)
VSVKIKRIYGDLLPDPKDGYRILVDRLWPRGVSKVKAELDEWDKQIGPSNDLRKWFGHDPEKYPEFKQRYVAELDANPNMPDFLQLVKEKSAAGPVVLLFGAKDETHNQAVVLQEYLAQKGIK